MQREATKHAQKTLKWFSAGAPPRTPLGELTTLPRSPSRLGGEYPSQFPTPSTPPASRSSAPPASRSSAPSATRIWSPTFQIKGRPWSLLRKCDKDRLAVWHMLISDATWRMNGKHTQRQCFFAIRQMALLIMVCTDVTETHTIIEADGC